MKIIPVLILLVLLSFPGENTAQNSSTYSRIGLGDIEYSYSARRLGMGQLGISVADPDFINSLNPAGWYKLNRTRIEFSLYYNGIMLSDNNSSGYFAETEFSGFTIAFPISKQYGIGAAAGLVPFSNVSYLVEQSGQIDDNEYTTTYEGRGGLTRAFIGTSYRLPFNLVAGASFDYYFGNLYYKREIDFISGGSLSAEYENKFTPKGIGGSFGLISPDLAPLFGSETISDFRLGGSINYFSKLDVDTFLTSSTSGLIDTLSSGNTRFEIPQRIIFGSSLVFSNKYLLSLDYSIQPWQNFKVGGLKQPNLRSANKVSIGFEYRPLRELGTSFWEQIIWRAGLSFDETQYIIGNEGIDQYSIAGGFSMPISPENTLDIGLQYSVRGTKNSNLIKENIIRLNLGISFGETWFIRPEN
jgi:hypothetical protein